MYDLGLLLYRDEVVHHTSVRDHLRRTLLEMVLMERKGEMADRCVGRCECAGVWCGRTVMHLCVCTREVGREGGRQGSRKTEREGGTEEHMCGVWG